MIIRTSESEKEWFSKLSAAYKSRQPIMIIDDANIGINPAHQTLFEMGKHAGITFEEWMAAGIALGISIVGIWMIYLDQKIRNQQLDSDY